jgi:predicted dehydrogenase
VSDSADKSRLRVAVIGVGALGQHHARIYGELAREGGVELTGVFDCDSEQSRRIAAEIGTVAHESIEAATEASDALSVVTPTVTHFEIAGQLLKAGRHVLVEKPMTDTSAHASALVELAHERGLVLQVGHVERFNPVLSYLEKAAAAPRFIETHRLSPYPKRSTDIGVVLDLMIHDLDVVLAFVKSPVVSVDAVGVPVLSRSEDIANARLKFENGCVANVTVSRVSPEKLRKIRVFSGGEQPSYISLDYQAQEGFLYRLGLDEEKESSLLKKLFAAKDSAIVSEFAGKKIVREPVPIEKEQPLKLELKHFVECVRERQTPIVSGASAKLALDLAFEITEQIKALDAKA